MLTIHIDNTGYTESLLFDDETLDNTFKTIFNILNNSLLTSNRAVVLIAGPPGSGKTCLSKTIEKIYNGEKQNHTLKSVGLDAFLFNNEYLKNNKTIYMGKEVPLMSIKGSYQTYDTELLNKKIDSFIAGHNVMCPIYDRNIHNPIPDKISLDCDILLLEGNWLLYNKYPWCDIYKKASVTFFVEPEANLLKDRMINRKVRHGFSIKEANDFYDYCESKNVVNVLSSHNKPDYTLLSTNNGHGYRFKK